MQMRIHEGKPPTASALIAAPSKQQGASKACSKRTETQSDTAAALTHHDVCPLCHVKNKHTGLELTALSCLVWK